jgi:hypothetical protein
MRTININNIISNVFQIVKFENNNCVYLLINVNKRQGVTL